MTVLCVPYSQVESQDMLRDIRGLETIMEIEELLLAPLFATILPHQVQTRARREQLIRFSLLPEKGSSQGLNLALTAFSIPSLLRLLLSLFAIRRRWRSNPSGKSSQERLTRGTVCGTTRSMCGADAGCSAINYRSLFATLAHHQVSLPSEKGTP